MHKIAQPFKYITQSWSIPRLLGREQHPPHYMSIASRKISREQPRIIIFVIFFFVVVVAYFKVYLEDDEGLVEACHAEAMRRCPQLVGFRLDRFDGSRCFMDSFRQSHDSGKAKCCDIERKGVHGSRSGQQISGSSERGGESESEDPREWFVRLFRTPFVLRFQVPLNVSRTKP